MSYELQVTSYRFRLLLAFPFVFCLFTFAFSQNPLPAPAQSKSILLMNGIAHIGNGKVIENSAIGIRNGKIDLIADATAIRLQQSAYDTTITITGKHVYPG